MIGRPNPGIYDWELSIYTIDLALALAARLRRGSSTRPSPTSSSTPPPRASRSPTTSTAPPMAPWRALDAGFTVGLVADHGMRAKAGADGEPQRPLSRRGAGAAGVTGAGPCARSPIPTWPTTRRSARWPGSTSTISPSSTVPGGRWPRCPGWRRCWTEPRRRPALISPQTGSAISWCSATPIRSWAAPARPTTSAPCTGRCVPTAACTSARSPTPASPYPRGALAGRELHNRDLHDILLNAVTAAMSTLATLPVRSPFSGELVGEAPVSSPERTPRARPRRACRAPPPRHARARSCSPSPSSWTAASAEWPR